MSTPPTEAMLRDWKRKEKGHPWKYQLMQRLEKKTPPTPNESKLVKDSQAEIRIVLSKQSAELKDRLKTLGFETVSEKALVLIGRINIERLAALAEIEEVKYLLPNI